MTRWYREKKREHYYKEAKKVGYRARSAFKLKQIQNKFHIFSKGDIVLDLGAAPGGWSQVVQEYVGEEGTVVGVDLLPIEPLDNVEFLRGDITKEEVIEEMKQMLHTKNVDVVLSDMSPNISGTYSIDQARSLFLCEKALEVAKEALKPKGNFVCKLFEGEDKEPFIKKIKRNFYIVKIFSPEASRKSSSEIYIIAKSFKKGEKYK